jgi:hypothetical protein
VGCGEMGQSPVLERWFSLCLAISELFAGHMGRDEAFCHDIRM